MVRGLSAAFVRTVTKPGKYSDEHGLILRVLPTGSKQWIWRGTVKGKRTDLGLGGYPYTSLAEARQTAFQYRKLARAGEDPREHGHGTSTGKPERGFDHGDVRATLEKVRKCREWLLTKLALEFIVLTACRSSEVLGARWEEVDRRDRIWTVPAQRMKAGIEHRVPLSRRARGVLAEARTVSESPGLIFRYRHASCPSRSTLSKLLQRLKIPVAPEGFRPLFRAWCEESRVPGDVVEAALAQGVRDEFETSPERDDLFKRRRAVMEDWGRHVTQRKPGLSERQLDELLQRAIGSAKSKEAREQKLLDFMDFMIEQWPSNPRTMARPIAKDLVKKDEAEWLVWFEDAHEDDLFAWNVVMALLARLRQRGEQWRLWRQPFFDWLLDVVQDPRSKPPGSGGRDTNLTRDIVICTTVRSISDLGIRPATSNKRGWSACHLVAERLHLSYDAIKTVWENRSREE